MALDDKGQTAFTLQFANGLRLHSMSSNPDAQAGKRGDRILDEFALHPDPRRLYAIAYPGITWGGSLEIFSTHRGSNNFFNQLILEARHQGNPKGFSLHRVSLQDALDQGFLKKLQQKLPEDDHRRHMDEAAYFDSVRAGCPDEETFLQEYCCQPGDDNAAFLSYDLIQSCEYSPGEPWELPSPSGIGFRPSAIGYRLSAIPIRLLAIGYRLSAIGYWLSAIGYWLLAIGYRLSAIGYRLLAIGYRLSAIGYRLLAIGYWL